MSRCLYYSCGMCCATECTRAVCNYTDQRNCASFVEDQDTTLDQRANSLQKAHAEEPSVTDEPEESLEKNVNHPKRYTKGKIECIDALESAVVGKTPGEAICVANVIKYLWRYEEKEPLRSLKSAEWYLKRLISKYEEHVQG